MTGRPRKPADKNDTRRRVLDFVRQAIGEGRPPTVREVQAALGFRAVQSAREQLEKLVAEGRLSKEVGRSRGYRLPDDPATQLVPILGRVPAGPLGEALEEPDGYLRIETRAGGRAVSEDRSRSPRRAGRASAEGTREEARNTRSPAFEGAPSFSPRSPYFALRVQGESMIGAGILDGDIVVVERGAQARDGDIVVARVQGEATVKRLRLFPRSRADENARIELRPENPAYAPIVIETQGTPPSSSGADFEGADVEGADVAPDFELLGRVVEVRRHYPGASANVIRNA